MRHQTFGKKLNRDIKERKALFKSLILALISAGKIRTTLARAKAIQRITEKLITKVKSGSENAIRQVSSFLTSKEATGKLTKEISPRFKNVTGGYLRLRRVGQRVGDASEEVILEWSRQEEKTVEKKEIEKEKAPSPVKIAEKKPGSKKVSRKKSKK